MQVKSRSLIAAICAIGAGMFVYTGTASASLTPTITAGHFDIVAVVDCDEEEPSVELELEDHNGTLGWTPTFAGDVFGNSGERFGGDPAILNAGGDLILGFEAEYEENCDGEPPVTFFIDDGDADYAVDGDVLAYDVVGSAVAFDTANSVFAFSGVTGHVDPRWTFTATGDYVLPIGAEAPSIGAITPATENLQLAIS